MFRTLANSPPPRKRINYAGWAGNALRLAVRGARFAVNVFTAALTVPATLAVSILLEAEEF